MPIHSHDALIISCASLGVASSKAISVYGDCAQDVSAMKESLRYFSNSENWNGGSIVDSCNQLSSGVA